MRRISKCTFIFIFALVFLFGCGSKKEEPDPDTSSADAQKAKDLVIVTESELDREQNNTEETAADNVSAEETEEPQKKNILIALDPGHQSPDVDMSAQEPNAPGSSVMKAKASGGTSGRYSGIPEYQLNLDIALAVRDRLTAEGYDVLMTREDNNTGISNAERASLANDAGADISVRIHANGSEDASVNGALVLIGSAENPYVGALYDDSFRLGTCILDAYCAETGMQNLGIQLNDTMTGINWSRIPVVILEMGFMTNQTDDMNMADPDYRTRMTEGIVRGINTYYGFE